MKAVILTAGRGERMMPLTANTPKALVKIAGAPILDRLVKNFPPEIDKFIIVIGYLGDQIKNYCGERFHGRPTTFIYQENPKGGNFQAVSLCRDLLEKDERFFVFYADDLIDAASVKQCLNYERAIVAAEVSDPSRFGVLEVSGDDFLLDLIEKPKRPASNLVLANALLLDGNVFNYSVKPAANGELYLTEAVRQMAKDRPIKIIRSRGWIRVTCPEDIEKAEKLLVSDNRILL